MVLNAEHTTGGASFLLQLALLGSLGWSFVWVLLTFSLLVFKATFLPFPPAALPMQIVAAFLVLFANLIGVFVGVRGNLTEDVSALGVSLALLLMAGVGALYYMWLQTYVMMLDLGFSAVFLGMNCLSLLAGVKAILRVSSRRSSLAPVVTAKRIDKEKQN